MLHERNNIKYFCYWFLCAKSERTGAHSLLWHWIVFLFIVIFQSYRIMQTQCSKRTAKSVYRKIKKLLFLFYFNITNTNTYLFIFHILQWYHKDGRGRYEYYKCNFFFIHKIEFYILKFYFVKPNFIFAIRIYIYFQLKLKEIKLNKLHLFWTQIMKMKRKSMLQYFISQGR